MKKNIYIEVGLILIVMGGLSFITYKQFALAKAKSRDSQRKSDLGEASKVIKLYFADYGKLPSETLINEMWGKSLTDNGYVYDDSVPKEKYGSKEYCYQSGEDGVSFKLSAELENVNDPDCKKDGQFCNGIKYCYTDIIYANKAKE